MTAPDKHAERAFQDMEADRALTEMRLAGFRDPKAWRRAEQEDARREAQEREGRKSA